MGSRRVRAVWTPQTITVYQAYRPEIAEPAVRAGRFVPPYKPDRMTWIKPSFLWMMYRSGWASKPGQERVLAVEITREGFEWALANAALSGYDRRLHTDRAQWSRDLKRSPVRVQWDPERTLRMTELPDRSLQVGLGGEAARRYATDWIVSLTDVTAQAHRIRHLAAEGDIPGATELLPPERDYPLPPAIATRLGATGSRELEESKAP